MPCISNLINNKMLANVQSTANWQNTLNSMKIKFSLLQHNIIVVVVGYALHSTHTTYRIGLERLGKTLNENLPKVWKSSRLLLSRALKGIWGPFSWWVGYSSFCSLFTIHYNLWVGGTRNLKRTLFRSLFPCSGAVVGSEEGLWLDDLVPLEIPLVRLAVVVVGGRWVRVARPPPIGGEGGREGGDWWSPATGNHRGFSLRSSAPTRPTHHQHTTTPFPNSPQLTLSEASPMAQGLMGQSVEGFYDCHPKRSWEGTTSIPNYLPPVYAYGTILLAFISI